MDPDVGMVREAGRRNRRRAAYAGAAGLALVVAVGVGLAKTADRDSGSTPDPVVEQPTGPIDMASLPQGELPKLPVWYAGSLHLGEQVYDMPRPQRIEAAARTVVIETVNEESSRLQLLTTSGLTTLPVDGRPVTWALSASGDIVVWADRLSDSRREMVAWDVATGEVLARRQMDVEVICCDASGELTVFGADAAGNVFGVRDDGFVWSPGTGALTRLPRVNYVDQVIATGPVLQSETFSTGFPGEAMSWQGGELQDIGPISYAIAPVTTDGRLAAYPSDHLGVSHAKGGQTAIAVETVGVGNPKVFEFSPGLGPRPIGWEPDGALLIEVSLAARASPDALIIRCEVDAHQCELALDLRGQGFWSGPE